MPDDKTQKAKPWFESFTISTRTGGLPIVEIDLPHAIGNKKHFKFMVIGGPEKGYSTSDDLYKILLQAFGSLKDSQKKKGKEDGNR